MSKFPEGDYKAKAVDAQLGYTSKGTEQIAVDFEILDEAFRGQRITWYGYFSEKTEERTLEALGYLGFGGDFANLVSLTRNEVTIVVGDKPNQDGTKTYSEVRFVNGPRKAKLLAPMSAEQVRAFQAKMKAKNGTVATAATGPKPHVDNSDIPF